MGKAQRTKGHGFERKVAKELRELGIERAMRNLEYQEGTGIDVAGDPLFVYQCKKGKRINELAAYKEIRDSPGKIKAVVAGHDYDVTLVCISWEDFKKIRKILNETNTN